MERTESIDDRRPPLRESRARLRAAARAAQRLHRHRGGLGPDVARRAVELVHRVLPDHRGMGESELGDPADVSIDGMAGDVAR